MNPPYLDQHDKSDDLVVGCFMATLALCVPLALWKLYDIAVLIYNYMRMGG